MNISETLSRGNRAENGDKIIYSYNHSNSTEYTVVAEKDKSKENFVTFYTNRKASDSGVSYTQLSAHANLSDASFDVAKVRRKSESAEKNAENDVKSRMNGLANTTGGDIRYQRAGGNGPAVAREAYDRMVASAAHQFSEAMQDSMQSLKDLMQAVYEAEGRTFNLVVGCR